MRPCDFNFAAIARNMVVKRLPVLVGHIQAVFVQQRRHFVVKIHEAFVKDVLYLRLADLELAQVVEVDLVDRTARCQELDEHPAKHASLRYKSKHFFRHQRARRTGIINL